MKITARRTQEARLLTTKSKKGHQTIAGTGVTRKNASPRTNCPPLSFFPHVPCVSQRTKICKDDVVVEEPRRGFFCTLWVNLTAKSST